MKYVLVDKGDNIVNTIELASNVGVSGARTYFLGTKRIDKKEFDNLWRVMTKDEYDLDDLLTEQKEITKFCTSCGSKNNTKFQFCTTCGEKLIS